MTEERPNGIDVPCPQCADLLKHSHLGEMEQHAQLSQITGEGSNYVLRTVGANILESPYGWFTCWGGVGSAKTLFLQAMTVAFCKAGTQAMYYHAGDLQDGLFADIRQQREGEEKMLTPRAELYRRTQVLCVDELDKWHNDKSGWSMKQLQKLLDHRYRNRDTHVTLIACNREPSGDWLPDDILSRMHDGRFNRPWPDSILTPVPGLVDGSVPAVYHVESGDMRPYLRR